MSALWESGASQPDSQPATLATLQISRVSLSYELPGCKYSLSFLPEQVSRLVGIMG